MSNKPTSPWRKYGPEYEKLIKDYFKNNLSVRDIEKATGVSRTTVAKHVRQYHKVRSLPRTKKSNNFLEKLKKDKKYYQALKAFPKISYASLKERFPNKTNLAAHLSLVLGYKKKLPKIYLTIPELIKLFPNPKPVFKWSEKDFITDKGQIAIRKVSYVGPQSKYRYPVVRACKLGTFDKADYVVVLDDKDTIIKIIEKKDMPKGAAYIWLKGGEHGRRH